MSKRFLCLVLLLSFLLTIEVGCAFADTDHDKDLKQIFYGKNSLHGDTDELKVLQWAAYFALDCTGPNNNPSSDNSINDEGGLAILRDYGVDGVPSDTSVFRYKGNQFNNQHHERYTHLGWDMDYANDPKGDLSNWETVRKPLLINAVRQVFLKGKKDFWSTVDFTGLFHQPRTNMTEQQIKSMAALIYYAHVLGDHCYNSRSTVQDRIPLARKTENVTNPGLITDLKNHLQIIFADQLTSSDYRLLIVKMDNIRKDIRTVLVNNDFPLIDQYSFYQNKAIELMNELKIRIPRLMEDSDFFPEIFIEPAA